jgi:site-specific DNA-methyltransferase (adenine-specific)
MSDLDKYLNRVIHANCLDAIKELPDNSVDGVIQDPPYEISFMGRKWDSTGVAYNVALYQEIHRVLKPNGYLLSFGATRTHHRIAQAIADGGFTLLPTAAWCYGNGFPKSHNISKSLDKRGGESVAWFGVWLKKWRKENGVKQKEVSSLFPSKTGGLTGCVSNWEMGASLPTNEQFNTICANFDLPFASLQEAEREIIGIQKTKRGGEGVWAESGKGTKSIFAVGEAEYEITAPATTVAREWEGYGTALKPAWEPIIVAIKSDDKVKPTPPQFWYVAKPSKRERNAGLDDMPDEFYAASNQAKAELKRGNTDFNAWKGKEHTERNNFNHVGISKNTHPTVKPVKLMKHLIEAYIPEGGVVLDCFIGSGTTGMAATMTDRNYIGIEAEEEYIGLANARINNAKNKPEDYA